MSAAACFRCDWEGETRGDACPRCGAPLYRPAPPAPRRTQSPPARPAPPVRRAGDDSARSEPAPGPGTVRRSGPWSVLGLMAVVGLILAVVWTRVPDGEEVVPRARPAARVGALVYASERGGSRLWKLDLATGRVVPGPEVPEVVLDLMSAPGSGPGWIVMTAGRANGTRRAFVLHGTGPSERPVGIGSGDLLAWGPGGASVVVARRGPLRDGCHRAITIHVVDVESGLTEREFSQRNLCGDLLSVGRDALATYFTRASGGRVGIFSAGIGVAHSVLPRSVLVSVSPAGDMIVTPTDARGGSLLLFRGLGVWRGRGEPTALGNGEDDLVVDRVLAWSEDATRAVVVGDLGDRPGVYLIRAGPGGDIRVPTFVIDFVGRPGATFSSDGVAYLVEQGRLYALEGSELTRVDLPEDAPPPAGPLAWMP